MTRCTINVHPLWQVLLLLVLLLPAVSLAQERLPDEVIERLRRETLPERQYVPDSYVPNQLIVQFKPGTLSLPTGRIISELAQVTLQRSTIRENPASRTRQRR